MSGVYDTEGNKRHIYIRDNFFNCPQPHQLTQLKEKKQVLQCTNSKIFFGEKDFPLLKLKG